MAPFNEDLLRTSGRELDFIDDLGLRKLESQLLGVETRRDPELLRVGIEHVRGVESLVE